MISKFLTATMMMLSFPLIAQEDIRFLSREYRFYKQEARQDRSQVLARDAVDPSKVTYELTAGLAHTRFDGPGHSNNIPFEFAATLPNRLTTFKLFGDGPTRISTPDFSASGWADTTLAATHTIKLNDSSMKFGGGIRVGSRSDVGSESEAVFLNAGYTMKLRSLLLSASGKISRDLERPAPGVNRHALSGALQAMYLPERSPVSAIYAQFGRGIRKGAGGSSFVAVGVAFQSWAGWEPSLTVARGTTSGSRDTSFEVDFTYAF